MNKLESMTKTPADQEFIEFVIKSIVDHVDDVVVERRIDEMGVLLTLKVHPEDMGQIIGRQGSTAKAVRTLLRVIGAKNNARINLKIEEPAGGRAPREGATAASIESNKDVDEVVGDLKL
ncbi:KH domain-containing protein [Patescibacteria group bacterium]